MFRSELTKNRIHFIGVGGIGMSGLAELLVSMGYPVSGSDLLDGESIQYLKNKGVKIFIGHDKNNLFVSDQKFPAVVVVSSAIPASNPELLYAMESGIRVMRRAELLSDLMKLKCGIAIAGTHGKTTTTSLIGAVLTGAGTDPTLVIGGKVNSLGTNVKLGQGKFLVAEADESDGSFLQLAPSFAIVTNIDNDHLSHFGNMETLEGAFLQFVERVPFYGLSVICADDPACRRLLKKVKSPHVTYGISEKADWNARNIEVHSRRTQFEVLKENKVLGTISIQLPGKHNILNSLASIAVCHEIGIPFEKIKESLWNFDGVKRRFEVIGEKRGIQVVDDYGHHPREIECTLEAARSIAPEKRLVVCFQPHRYTRTRDCFEFFKTCFNEADLLFLTEIYPAGEVPIPGIDSASLKEEIEKHALKQGSNLNVKLVSDLNELSKEVSKVLKPGDLLLCLGAGSITKVSRLVYESL